MEQQTVGATRNKQKEKRTKIIIFIAIIGVLFSIFSYVNQSATAVVLTYDISDKNKQIDALKIKVKELQLENERLQSSAYIEKYANEKLGMVNANQDKVVVVKETASKPDDVQALESSKIKIFVQTIFDQVNASIAGVRNGVSDKFVK